MADSINRITPPAIAPERAAERRERDKNMPGGAHEREREPQERGAPPAELQEEDAPKDQFKGNRVDINA